MNIFLETERLILRLPSWSNLDNLVILRSDPAVMKYIGDGSIHTKAQVERFLNMAIPYQEKYGFGFCSVFKKETNEFIGQAGLFHKGFYDQQPDIELAYRLHKKYWGYGYATELAKALIHWAFENLKVDKIVSAAEPENIASQKVLLKSGFLFLGKQKWWNGTELFYYENYKSDAIEISAYQEEWPKIAALEIKKLLDILPKQHIIDLQQVGSTAIPGMSAKPVIDIQIAVDSLDAIKPMAIKILKELGYEYWDKNPDPDRLFFAKGMPPFGTQRTHHIHIVEPNSRHWREKILFRDYLQNNSEARLKYEALKIQLAQQYKYDREQYTSAKTEFVHKILRLASDAAIRISNSYPMIIFITGASGVGKTTLLNQFCQEKNNKMACFHFDSIGVPSEQEMLDLYGSGSEWQKAMTYHWVQKFKQYLDKDLILIEGQVNLTYIESALRGLGFYRYQIILVHCENNIRHQRLAEERLQPELINSEMDNWSQFLKKQAVEKNAVILDTTQLTEEQMLVWLKEYLRPYRNTM